MQSKCDSNLKELFEVINHSETEIESIAERQVLKKINANCNSPVSVYAKIENDMISVQCDIFDHDGNRLF